MSSIRITTKIATPTINRLQAALANPSGSEPLRAMQNQWGARMQTFTTRRFNINSRGGGDWPPLAASTIDQRRFGKGSTIGKARTAANKRITSTSKALAKAERRLENAIAGESRARSASVGATSNVKELRAKLLRVKAAQAVQRSTGSRGKAEQFLDRVLKAADKTSILIDKGVLRKGLQLGFPGNVRQPFVGRGVVGVRYGIMGGAHPSGGMSIGRLAAIHQRGTRTIPPRKIIVKPDDQTVRAMRGDLARAIRTIRKGGGAS